MAQAVVGTADKPRNTAEAAFQSNPWGPGSFLVILRCPLFIGSLPNLVGSASTDVKSAAVAAMRNAETDSGEE